MELKPCPFCGGTELEVISEYHQMAVAVYYVKCNNMDCRTEGPVDLGESGAIERWNTRPGECAEPTPTHEEPHT